MATTTIYPSADGWVNGDFDDGHGGGYSTAHATATGSAVGTGYLKVGQYTPLGDGGAELWRCVRSLLAFDTSGLAALGTVTAVSLRLTWYPNDESTADFDVTIRNPTWSPPLSGADDSNYDAALGGSLLGTIANTIDAIDNGDITLSGLEGVVNTSGTTYLSIVSANDKSATAPTDGLDEGANFYDSTATSSKRPALIVTYTPAAAGQPTGRRLGTRPWRRMLSEKTQGGVWSVPAPSVARLPGVALLAA